MKQLLLSGLLFTALGFTALQSDAQVAVGVRAGVNFNNVTLKDNDGKTVDGTKILPGFNAGITFDIPVADEFYIQPGALFSSKGTKATSDANEYLWLEDNATNDDNTKMSAYYLEVPVNFLYKPALGTGRLLLGVGPYVAYGLGGKYKDDYDGSIDEGKLEFVKDYNDASENSDKFIYGKPFDYGANLLAGYEFSNRFSAQLNAQLGLANLEPNDDGQKPDAKFKNIGFGVSVGYKF